MILIDGHVHLRHCFDPQAFLNAAYTNLTQVARHHGAGDGFDGVLCLTDAAGEQGYERLRALHDPSGEAKEAWRCARAVEEGVSLWMAAPGSTSEDETVRALLVIAGRQIITSEGLEVLAIGTRHRIEDGMSLTATVQVVQRCGALPVIPWGFGKWMGRRGRVLAQLLADEPAPPCWLGDTANRPRRWPMPALLRRAAHEGRPVLPGSDPLPRPTEQNRAGTYGACCPGRLDPDQPAADLLTRLRAHPEQMQPYGRGESLRRFVVNQIASQVAKRRG